MDKVWAWWCVMTHLPEKVTFVCFWVVCPEWSLWWQDVLGMQNLLLPLQAEVQAWHMPLPASFQVTQVVSLTSSWLCSPMHGRWGKEKPSKVQVGSGKFFHSNKGDRPPAQHDLFVFILPTCRCSFNKCWLCKILCDLLHDTQLRVAALATSRSGRLPAVSNFFILEGFLPFVLEFSPLAFLLSLSAVVSTVLNFRQSCPLGFHLHAHHWTKCPKYRSKLFFVNHRQRQNWCWYTQ